MPRRSLAFLASASLIVCACHPVVVPLPSQDHPPEVTIMVADHQRNTSAPYKADETISVASGTTLQFIVTGYNASGGVKDLLLSISDRTVHTSATPDAKGEVPVQLALALDNGAPITSAFVEQGRRYEVTAVATNFNAMVTTVRLTFVVAYKAPTISSFKFDLPPNGVDNGGYLNLGESTHLNWTVNDCNGCAISLSAFDNGPSYDHQTVAATNLSAPSGRFAVQPAQQWTRYVLVATSPYGSASATKVQQIFVPATGGSSASVFYFKVYSASYCWTQAVAAASEGAGQQIVQSLNVGMQVEAIGVTAFGNPATCGH